MGFIKFIENSKNFEKLIRQRPTAFLLLALIAQRAKRSPDNFSNLELGEAYIGDYESYGATEQQYRTDKEYLKKYNFSTFRSTNKGTIARIVDISIFDISLEKSTSKSTNDQRATNEQLTTNRDIRLKNINTDKSVLSKNRRDENVDLILSEFVQATGREPADKKPRWVAQTWKRQTLKFIEEMKPYKPLVFAEVIKICFSGYMAKYPAAEVKHLDTIRRDVTRGLYEATKKKYIPGYKLPSEI